MDTPEITPEPESPLFIDHGERVTETDTPTDGPSELERHKASRTSVPDPEPPPVPEAAAPETPEKKKDERWKDPETGDVYDMRHKVARRIKQVLEKAAKAEERAAQVERERDEYVRLALQGRQQPTPEKVAPKTDDEPDPGDTTKYPEGQFDRAFIRDMGRWAARQETQQFAQTSKAEQAQSARHAAETRAVTQWQSTLPDARKRYENFDAVLESIPNTPANAPIARIMMGSPVGNDVVYVLGTQPEAMQAYQSAPNDESRLRLLYHIEAQLITAARAAKKTTPPATTRAPAPIEPIHTGAGPAGPIDWGRTDDPDQLARWKAIRSKK